MFCNILLLFVCILTIKKSLNVPTTKRSTEHNTTFKELFRRQHGPVQITPPMALGGKKKAPKGLESYYEPYREKGDWVYYRGDSTRRPHPFYLNEGNTTQHDECNQICPQFVQNYGYLCGMRYNYTFARFDYKTFEDYCYLELENCYWASKRLKWYPVRKGNCTGGIVTQTFHHMLLVTKVATHESRMPYENIN